MRKEFQLSPEQLARLLKACRPTPAMWGSGGMPMFNTPQENANEAWRALGREMGFQPFTVQPIPGKSQEWFTAEEACTE